MTESQEEQVQRDDKRVYYFSLEYLMGRLLQTNLDNLAIEVPLAAALKELGQDYEKLRHEEDDPGLGNGGLGRLAACFMDSLATLDIPAIGYGILYEFGLFRQAIVNNRQEEMPDNWLRFGNPWCLMRTSRTQTIRFGGRIETVCTDRGDTAIRWVDTQSLIGVPWDVPVAGYRGQTVNFLRLWQARASEEFNFKKFDEGGYIEAVRDKTYGETVSKILYPNDKLEDGKKLRLLQQYFFASCSLQDILRRYQASHKTWDEFPKKVVIQLNDTHPSIAVPELMRLLIDEEGFAWEDAWKLCRSVFAYTNHTLLPEALEKWSVPLMRLLLPRHLKLIYEINDWFLKHEVEKQWPGDDGKKRELSLIEEGEPQYVRMAYLAIVGSFSVNGVAELHTRLLRQRLFPGFDTLYPNKFNNKTNGITPRRWLHIANPRLSNLITEALGNERWVTDLEQLRGLEKFAEDDAFLERYRAVKQANKADFARWLREKFGFTVDPNALFDVQVKRIHEYKRQHLKLLHCLKLYFDLLHGNASDAPKRVVLIAGKAAPGYLFAKEIIHAVNVVAQRVNNDQRLNGKLQIFFLPDYNVSLAERIIPTADLSEQISTAGKEASGTGNMKLGLNGACTIGTLDGANVEMLERVGAENIFIFGHTVEELEELQQNGYRPYDVYNADAELKCLLDWMSADCFEDNGRYPLRAVRNSLLDGGDPFFVLADFRAYCDAQQLCERLYQQPRVWTQKALFNTARLGYFSSDRTIREYVRDVWEMGKRKRKNVNIDALLWNTLQH
jgi:starch phosphorylase